MRSLLRFLRWVFEKFAAAVLIVGLGFVACALWLYLKDSVDFDQWRRDLLREVSGERAKVAAALGDVHRRMDRISDELTTQRERAQRTDKVLEELKDLQSTWDRFVGNPAQQKANAEQIENMTALRRSLTDKIKVLQQDFTRATWERDGLEIALEKVQARQRAVEAQQSRIMHYAERAWDYRLGPTWLNLPVKWWMAAALVLYFLGPTVGKLTMYFVVAPRIARGRPVRLAEKLEQLPEVAESKVAAELALRPGERLWVKEKFLQTCDEGVGKRTRYLLDWRIPFTCLATGLVELIELKNSRMADATSAGGATEQRVTLANQANPHSELAVVTLPERAALVLRPSFLAGAITASDQRLKIRRRWQLFRWQSWVTLQFRFFEFVGPCRLIVAGSRGVRVEDLSTRLADNPARRTNQDATMGFTPNLDYRPVRAETFWSYYRGMNPLFDDLFAGRGMFLCQQVSTAGDTAKARRFWSGVWGGVMKVFGL